MRLKTRPMPTPGAVRWLLAACWMGGIFYLSQQSSPLAASPSELESNVAHVVLYGTLAALLYWAVRSSAAGDEAGQHSIVFAFAFALAVLYGVSDELHQAFVPGRTASRMDVAFDAIGAILGLGAVLAAQLAVLALRSRNKNAPNP
jgi:VanZ family protein